MLDGGEDKEEVTPAFGFRLRNAAAAAVASYGLLSYLLILMTSLY